MKNKKLIYLILGVIIFISFWYFTALKINSEIVFPNIPNILKKLIEIISEKSFYKDLLSSLLRVLITFSLSFLSAFIIGISSGIFMPIRYTLIPIINFIRTIPTIPLILVAIIWFDNNTVPIFVSMLIIFPIMYDSITNGIMNVDKKLIEMSISYNVSLRTQIIDLYIPYIKPYIFTGISQSMGITWKSILAAEILALPAFGIGTKLYESHLYLDSVSLFAYCLIAIIFNAVFEIIIRINHDK
ncbi:ABC transporter permease [Brachyspira hampsonii]|uniref:ABC transporter permease n=1 Tax=Brachyspira hampsonii 30446 TaxID=1289135 RepID=A0A2U4F0T4_9SPIR|nr:ABC transporter permease subunit [Brachyspira hampsonii]EKV55847.1 ABC transporter permease [Brachyspira hampsonii 30446]MBW5390988.1 ABC transporter permease subunit [Brachyspira hampsonii]MBW5395571.1 ABC transporter permease subunit [Brachyspira hampsonii]OEJ13367.1 ABC transporter permease [Brachyspira hampsonii]